MQTNIPSESLRRHQRCEMTGCVTESLREDCKLLVGPVPHPFSGGVGGGGVPLFNSTGFLDSELDGAVFVR